MRVILRKATHAHQTMQRTGRLVTVARAKLGQAQRQIAVRTQITIKDLDVTRAVHRLDGVDALFRFRDEHIVVVVLPVTRALPQHAIHHLRRAHFLVAGYAKRRRMYCSTDCHSCQPLGCQNTMPGASSCIWNKSSALPILR